MVGTQFELRWPFPGLAKSLWPKGGERYPLVNTYPVDNTVEFPNCYPMDILPAERAIHFWTTGTHKKMFKILVF